MYKCLALTSLLLSTSFVQAASLQIANSSFETPTLQNGGSVSIAADGAFYQWKVDIFEQRYEGPGQVKITNPLSTTAGPVLDGSNVAILQPGTTLYQTFDGSKLINANSFKFSADMSHLTQSGCCSDWGIYLRWQENSVSKFVSIIDANSNIAIAENQITHYEFETQLPGNFSPDNGLVTLSINDFGAASRDFLIDNVAITVTPVPLPGAAWLFLTGILTIGRPRSRFRKMWNRHQA